MMDSGHTEAAIMQRLQHIATWTPAKDHAPRRLIYMIEITGVCSLGCPVCYASAGTDACHHLPPERILALGRKIREDGGRFVQLIGGEPAEHPQLLAIIRGLRRIGLRPVMATNGIRLAQDASFAASLRRAGLRKVNLQFDTLVADTSVAMRGRDLVSLKQQAITKSAAAGLRIGLVATLCHRNVHEAGDILHVALSHMPALNTVTFQTLARSGRIPADIRPVDRVAILYHLLDSSIKNGLALSPQDILPPPQYAPWRALVHPACASLLLICQDDARLPAWSLGRDVDMERCYATLHGLDPRGHGMLSAVIRPALALRRAARRGTRLATVQRFLTLATARGSRGLCVVHVDAIMDDASPDPERVRRCPACFVTAQGFIQACSRYRGGTSAGVQAP